MRTLGASLNLRRRNHQKAVLKSTTCSPVTLTSPCSNIMDNDPSGPYLSETTSCDSATEPLSPVSSTCSCENEPNPHLLNDSKIYGPPIPSGGSLGPILLPNELLLQKFAGKHSFYRTSERMQYFKQNEISRRHSETDASQQSSSGFSSLASKLKSLSSGSTANNNTHSNNNNGNSTNTQRNPPLPLPPSESDYHYLTKDRELGAVYVTSERIIFVPKETTSVGFSVDIVSITSMKAIGSENDSWFFLCYVNDYMTTIPFRTKVRARSFVKLISNIRFEHMVRSFLPPRYSGRNCKNNFCRYDEPEEWAAEDQKLPSYDESEDALRLYLVSRGLLASDETFDRSSRAANIAPILALASAPPVDSRTQLNGLTDSAAPGRNMSRYRVGSRRESSPSQDALYNLPFVWY